jgi:hypothetical protein
MKNKIIYFLLILFLLFFSFCDNQKKITSQKTLYKISGKAYSKTMFCGGIKPPEEVIKEFSKPFEIASSTLIFKNKSDSNIVVLTKTDKFGNFSVKLNSGTWLLYLSKDFSDNNDGILKKMNIDKKCVNLYNTIFAEIEIINNIENYNLILVFNYNLCNTDAHLKP